jgi:hypothetical protein
MDSYALTVATCKWSAGKAFQLGPIWSPGGIEDYGIGPGFTGVGQCKSTTPKGGARWAMFRTATDRITELQLRYVRLRDRNDLPLSTCVSAVNRCSPRSSRSPTVIVGDGRLPIGRGSSNPSAQRFTLPSS